jgi:hypothetical protein
VRAPPTARKLVQAKRHDIEMSLRGILRGFGLIAAVAEIVGASGSGDGGEKAADALPKFVCGACGGLTQLGLELGEELLDRVEIGAVGRR